MTKLLLIVTTTFLAFGCGKKPAPQPVVTTPPPPPPARPAEAAPFTVSYTYKGKADTSGLLYTVSSDGAAAATVASPPKRYLGKALPEYVKDLAELLADPELRAIPLRTENGPLPIVEVELIDAKGAIWRRYIAGDPPAAARPLMSKLEDVQRMTQREERVTNINQVDLTRTPAGGGPVTKLMVSANSLVLVTVDDKPKALGRVGTSDLDALKIGSVVVEKLPATGAPGTATGGATTQIKVAKADGKSYEKKFAGNLPLGSEFFFMTLAELEASAKPVALFDEITYKVPIPGKGKRRWQILTVKPTGKMTLTTEEGQVFGEGDMAVEELWGLLAVLVGFEALPSDKPIGKGDDTLKVVSPSGTREVRAQQYEGPPEAKKVLLYMNRFLIRLSPKLPD